MSRKRRGFVLITLAGSAIVVVGMLGLATDLGRLYIVRNESQAYADSAALGAALQLDGTLDGLSRARTIALSNVNRWNMGTQAFADRTVEFSTTGTGGWQANPGTGAGYRFVRVIAAANVGMHFVPVLGQPQSMRTGARAVAGQVEQTSFREGAFPFSPIIHNETPPYFGLTPGQLYTLRWAASPSLKGGNPNVCDGDRIQSIVDKAIEVGDERGFIEETSASIIREAIEGSYQTRVVEVGGTVEMTGGAKQTQYDSLINRVNQDTDATSKTFQHYITGNQGNGRRIVVVPLNTWSPNYTVLGFAAFFLLDETEYKKGGNWPICAEFVGAYVQGAPQTGAGEPGAYKVRLIE
jgi:hypothetical protein